MRSNKTLKVGQWWEKLDEQQQEAFKVIYFRGSYDVNPIRKFLTATKKKFTGPVIYCKKFLIESDGRTYEYSHEADSWRDLTEWATPKQF